MSDTVACWWFLGKMRISNYSNSFSVSISRIVSFALCTSKLVEWNISFDFWACGKSMHLSHINSYIFIWSAWLLHSGPTYLKSFPTFILLHCVWSLCLNKMLNFVSCCIIASDLMTWKGMVTMPFVISVSHELVLL